MKSSYLTNLILIIVIAGLFWLTQQASAPDDSYKKLSNVSADIINDITIKHAHRNDIKLHKQTTGWKIIQPIAADGNRTRIRLLLSLLSAPIHNQLNDITDTSLKKLGLKPVKVSLQLNQQLFVFGDVEPISKRRYVLHNNTCNK